ncbi:MAG: hypothetical protein Q8R43_00390 [Alphaproteobacteria bacterium]|nr:hypothetical protein [Alphaproteobacteria bacterium]
MRTTEKERRHYVDAFHRSGLRPAEFCNAQGLNPKTFYAWRKRYSSTLEEIRGYNSLKPAFLGEPSFLPLQIKDDETPADVLPKQPIQFSFKTKNFCLEVALDAQHNGADFKLIVQTLHELS